MTLGAQIPAIGLLMLASACSIQRDVPDFTYPASGVPADAVRPALQPTDMLIVDSSADAETYQRTIALLDGRAYVLRREVANSGTASQP